MQLLINRLEPAAEMNIHDETEYTTCRHERDLLGIAGIAAIDCNMIHHESSIVISCEIITA